MKTQSLIDGLKILKDNVQKVLGENKGMTLERRLCERRFVELCVMNGNVKRVNKKWWE